MDHPPNSQTSQRRLDRPTRSVRQPVSCEPCRRRKIKCSQTRPPCDTCRRRGCADSCIFKKFHNENLLRNAPATSGNEELLERISNLEYLLRKHARDQNCNHTIDGHLSSPMLSPPMESGHQLEASPVIGSLLSRNPSQASYSSELASAMEIGVLTTSSNGNVRYDARPSQWTSILANTGLSNITPSLDDQDDLGIVSGFPFTTMPVSSVDELLALLPPTQQCDYLKDTYFAVFSPLFHILHDPTFHALYAQFTNDPSSVPISWLAVLFILLSLSVTALEETDPILRDLARGPDPSTNVRVLSRRYREAAMKCLVKQGVFWGKHNVQSLQALVLLIYAMGHSQDPTWVLLGMTYNVSTALACHIDPENFNLDPIQCEERRRCWAGLIMQYTIQNTFLGNLDPSRRINYAVKLPADVNDTDVMLSGIRENVSGPTQMSYLLFKFRLYEISAEICHQTFTSTEPSRLAIQELDNKICVAQESWDNRYLADSTFETLPTHHAVHLHILHAYAHQLFLLLHRPFFARSVVGLDIPNESQIRCIASAEALLDIHKILLETPAFRPYMWYTNGLGSFHAFHAGVVLAVALLMPIYKPQYRKFKKTLDEMLKRFEASAGRSKICEKSIKILRFLLATPSPNQASTIATITNTPDVVNVQINWEPSDQIRFFAEKLQSQQWLGPGNIPWTQWDEFISQIEGIPAL